MSTASGSRRPPRPFVLFCAGCASQIRRGRRGPRNPNALCSRWMPACLNFRRSTLLINQEIVRAIAAPARPPGVAAPWP